MRKTFFLPLKRAQFNNYNFTWSEKSSRAVLCVKHQEGNEIEANFVEIIFNLNTKTKETYYQVE